MIGWWRTARRLARNGVLGMNARNAGPAVGLNPRPLVPVVDDKLRMLELFGRVGIPTPKVFAVFERFGDIRHLDETLALAPDCVIKPARGSSGRGVVVLTGWADAGFCRHDGGVVSLASLRRQVADMVSGMHSLGGRPDRAMVQQRLGVHPTLARISYRGTPDVRVLVYRGEPAMTMLRLPTLESGGRANLHQGGVGVGVGMTDGRTTQAVWHGRAIDRHPDTGEPVTGRVLPDWGSILELAGRVARATGLGYVGVDIVIDPETGPTVLEANARPGLAIQLANGLGLKGRLEAIDTRLGRR